MAHPSAEAIELGLNTADPATLVIDLNCAFASIEQQHDPELRGRVLAIAAYATDAATIVSSSREARDLGIKTGMHVFEARAIFPRMLVREPNPPLYREASDKLIEILERHSPDVLRMSIDEASLNLAGTPDLKKLGPEGVGLAIKRAIREEVGECVTASVGVSTSIWMACIPERDAVPHHRSAAQEPRSLHRVFAEPVANRVDRGLQPFATRTRRLREEIELSARLVAEG